MTKLSVISRSEVMVSLLNGSEVYFFNTKSPTSNRGNLIAKPMSDLSINACLDIIDDYDEESMMFIKKEEIKEEEKNEDE